MRCTICLGQFLLQEIRSIFTFYKNASNLATCAKRIICAKRIGWDGEIDSSFIHECRLNANKRLHHHHHHHHHHCLSVSLSVCLSLSLSLCARARARPVSKSVGQFLWFLRYQIASGRVSMLHNYTSSL